MRFNPDSNLLRARGFSLVELMVALVIGLLVLAAVSTVMVNSKKNYTVQDSLARLQENARVAVDFISRDLRTAGYYGCSSDHAAVNNIVNLAGAGALYDVGSRIEAVENGSATWYPTGIANADLVPPLTGIVPGTDALTLRFMTGAGVPIIPPFMTDPAAALAINPGSGLKQGDIVMVADCSSADVFQITSDAPDTSGTLEHAVGVGSPGNAVAQLGKNADKTYEDKSFIATLTAVRYFIGARCTTATGAKCATGEDNGAICTTADSCKCDNEHRCSLFRQFKGNIEELVEGIESMQVLYGEDTDVPADRVANVYVSGDLVTSWLRVVSVRVGLLAYTQASETASGEYGGVTDSGPYDVNGTELSVDNGNLEAKRVKRRVFTTTVSLRNQPS